MARIMMNATPRASSPFIVSKSPLQTTVTSLPILAVPGNTGFPVLGPLKDRMKYFWFQGPETFFRKKIDEYKSTVFRVNVPPAAPFLGSVNPSVIAVLDVVSFSHLFDMDIVEKKNVLVGDFMPSVNYTGGQRVCAYLDTTEAKHSQLKNFAMEILKKSSTIWVPTLISQLDIMWNTIESDVSKSGSAGFLFPSQRCLFNFLTRCLVGADVSVSPEVAKSGPIMLDLWLAFQLLPTVHIGALQPLPEIFAHSFAYPSILVRGGYNKLVQFVEKEGKEVIERGKTEFSLTHDEVIHNILFILGFNAYGGFSLFFLSLIGALEKDTTGKLQENLRKEVRSKSESASSLTFESVKEMELVLSFVYETLRLDPPVPLQYARAREDFVLSSHEARYQIKKGELLCGFQPLVMRDARVFDDPETFMADRFTNQGKELLQYLFWSNGPQTGVPSQSNKQCAGKDYVTLTAALFIAHIFQRYDSISVKSASIVAVQKAK